MFLRIRPQKNGKMEPTEYLHPQDSKTLKVTVPEDSQNYKKGRIEAEFEYQDIFLPASTQEQVFDTTTKPLLDGFLQGNSCLIMAYGVTGSGKTYTVLGPGDCPGLIPRSLSYIIDGMGTPEFKNRFKDELDHISLEMSFLEDYQNNIYDLLSPTIRSGQSKPSLMARSDMQGVLHVVGLTEKTVKSKAEGMQLIELGTKEKHMAETKMNLDSSRSHTMCTLNLIRTRQFTKDIIASCRIVDLAGSERVSRTQVTGERTVEAGAINTDLLYLMLCLRTMVNPSKNNQRMIFRNCKLTHLLSTSIIGSLAGPVHMILNISSDRVDFDETFYVLEQTTIVKNIKTVQTRVDSKPPPLRTAGGRRLGAEGETTTNTVSIRPLQTDEVDRLKRLLTDRERELRTLREKRDEEIQQAIDITEYNVRREIVAEITKRKAQEEDPVQSDMRTSFEMLEKQQQRRIEAIEAEKTKVVEELRSQLMYVEEDNMRLQRQIDVMEGRSGLNGNLQVEKVLNHIEEMEHELAMMKDGSANINGQMDDYEKMLSESELKLQEKERKVQEMEKQIQSLQTEKEELKKQKQMLLDRLAANHNYVILGLLSRNSRYMVHFILSILLIHRSYPLLSHL
ncbi:kinesin-like protein [Blastocystis sp. subtype 4]|uniref:kinesin-like protein n=1 Tax=Blastocystis sp. subtype 4 TaxID=944170 RepID=UPI00071222E5|nr:kinesin-like protein [Blastocystis sp. subtype 4]KNB43857.1 kinesin-like protein [Blastocystis sp. subtype 4]|eukprot:XP_014527300.1 kinesin-like protein [Blastocystis sp. subtype 4]